MTARARGVLVLVVQLALVLSIAAKYAWERHSCPMVWTRTAQGDPEQPLRGRYLALTLRADACGLSRESHEDRDDWASVTGPNVTGPKLNVWSWQVVPAVRDGKLAPALAIDKPGSETEKLTLRAGMPCEAAVLSDTAEFFVAEHAKSPFPLAKGEELWVLVTVPPQGPPRPVELAVSDGKSFRPLDMRQR